MSRKGNVETVAMVGIFLAIITMAFLAVWLEMIPV
jgi:hypothetical protein